MRPLVSAVAGLLELGMRHPVFGRCDESYTDEFVAPKDDGISPATMRELNDGSGFFTRLGIADIRSVLEGKDVLDLGCGYGGRTIYYASEGATRRIVGLEIDATMASYARSAARALARDRSLEFVCAVGEAQPFADSSFDVVLSYDVFEHVADLAVVLAECKRVLRPGGRVYALFPPYFGPRAHHLDFVTTLPFLHYVFPSPLLVEAVNVVTERHPELRRTPFRPIERGAPLPTLNGTTERAFRKLVARSGFEPEHIRAIAVGWQNDGGRKGLVHRVSQGLIDGPLPFPRDVLTSTIRCILRKPVD